MSTLYRGGFVYSPVDPFANAMVVDGDTIAWIGGDDAARVHESGVDEVVELDGALVTPAFVDAHAHLSQTGAAPAGGRPLHGALAGGRALAGRGRRPRPPGPAGLRPQLGRAALARAPARHRGRARPRDLRRRGLHAPRRRPLRGDLLSARRRQRRAGSSRAGVGDGLVTRDAHHVAREAFNAAITPAQRRADIDLALRAAAAAGIGLVHENGGPHPVVGRRLRRRARPRGSAETAPRPSATGASSSPTAQEAREAAAARRRPRARPATSTSTGRSARAPPPARALRRRRGPPRQRLPRASSRSRDHVAACSLAGLQAGFHVIGDAGVDDGRRRLRGGRRARGRRRRAARPGTGSSTSR